MSKLLIILIVTTFSFQAVAMSHDPSKPTPLLADTQVLDTIEIKKNLIKLNEEERKLLQVKLKLEESLEQRAIISESIKSLEKKIDEYEQAVAVETKKTYVPRDWGRSKLPVRVEVPENQVLKKPMVQHDEFLNWMKGLIKKWRRFKRL